MTTAAATGRRAWAGRAVSVDEVAGRLAELRRPADGGQPLSLAAVLNLVAYAPADEELPAMRSTIELLADHQPSLAVLVREDDDGDGLDAEALSHCGTGGRPACVAVELVVLRLGAGMRGGAASAVAPLLRTGLPTFLWWPGAPSPEGDAPPARLVAMADRVVTEAGRAADGPAGVRALAAWAPGCGAAVTDLGWAAITTWRQLIAQVLDRRGLDDLRAGHGAVAVGHGGAVPPVDALLLAGWLADLIGPRSMIEMRPERPSAHRIAAIELTGARSGRTMTIRRLPGRHAAEVRVDGPGGAQRRTLPLPRLDRASLLAGELELQRRDPVFERAVAAAAALAAG
ncbi:glucose-6-phosphate dehydrogenase assembly protein OpcA [Miltoncostaea marina]|uniref:glucose-6-phosphate dehydrogenase assembly protein OpcA n=1 Tax=Miltoncostaea marina TaxID=2843215 RepID=UPI001C3CBD74|nr:glucose-6-phosphate dehydrogenase assembly protein OpcA [Miltoncostaea marina]